MIKSLTTIKRNLYQYSWAEIFLVAAIFTKEIGSSSTFGIDFDYLGYPFFIIYFSINFIKIATSKFVPKLIFLYLIISSVTSIIILDLSMSGFLKQIIPICIVLSVCFYVLSKSNIQSVFLLYVKITYWTAIFGIIQVALSYFGVNLIVKVPGKLDSIAYEPSHYASLLLPALVYCYLNLREYKFYFFIMLLALLLTYNLTAYLVFLGILTFSSFNPIYIFVTVPIAYYIFFNVLPNFSENFSLRFNDTFSTFRGEKSILTSSLEVNGTTLSLYSNLEVAKDVISQNPLTGAGLGGHEEMYYRHFDGSAFSTNFFYGVNAKSAHSLSIRILSELGLVGSAWYLYFMIKSFVFSRKGIYYAISISCISHFLCKSFKLGGYIDYGTPFFFAVLVLNARAYRRNKKNRLSLHAQRKQDSLSLHPVA